MLLHEIDDTGLDVWPDRRRGARRGGVSELQIVERCDSTGVDITGLAARLGARAAQLAHVGHRHDDGQVEPLVGRWRHHPYRGRAAEVARHLLHGSNGRGQPDALRRSLQQRVEAFQ
jgi:hypothetical protein